MTIALALTTSTPSFSDFDPSVIPYQDQVVDDVLCQYDYSLGVHEILLSGSVGSAKSILMAHLAVRHCLEYAGARVILGRNALPDLKKTIFKKIQEHVREALVKGRDYWERPNIGEMRFRNGSEIISTSWADRDYMKVRSIDASMAIFEELTENDEQDKQAYIEIKMRVGRLPHVPQALIISATNPDAPSHWAFEYFELDKDESLTEKSSPLGLGPNGSRTPTKHVYYSVTEDNPFLPKWYIEQLKRDLDPKMAMRMLRGRWIELKSDGIYYAYDRAANFRERDYVVNPSYPVILTWDFNIGDGKPLSMAVMQLTHDGLHIFGEVVVEGIRTVESCEELADRGFLDLPVRFVVSGDSSGKNRDTRNNKSDYEIIEKYLRDYVTRGIALKDSGLAPTSGQRLAFERNVPVANPALRKRHNTVNAYCRNEAGEHRLFVYRGAPTVDKALRLTALKPGGNYIEDDSKPFQHVGTAVGYGLLAQIAGTSTKKQGTVLL